MAMMVAQTRGFVGKCWRGDRRGSGLRADRGRAIVYGKSGWCFVVLDVVTESAFAT